MLQRRLGITKRDQSLPPTVYNTNALANFQADFRPDELEEFKEAFALFDDNGSGQIEARCLPINAIVPVSYRL